MHAFATPVLRTPAALAAGCMTAMSTAAAHVAAVLLCASLAMGQVVGGVIDTDTVWEAGRVYTVTETVVVTGNATLTIEHDVRVNFDPGTGMIIGPGPDQGGTGTGELIVNGGAFPDYTLLVGGTGLTFGPATVPGRVDPDTGVYLEGSRLRGCRVSGTRPSVVEGEAFAVRMGAAMPHMDDARVGFSTGGGMLVDLTDAPDASVRWAGVRFEEVTGAGLVIRGGREHELGLFTSQETRPLGSASAAMRVEPGPFAGPDGYDLLVRSAFLDEPDIATSVVLGEGDFSDGDRRYRFEEATFRRCRTGILLDNDTDLELDACEFEFCDVPVNADRSRTSVTVGDSSFTGGGPLLARTLRVEDCAFIGNTGSAIRATVAVAYRCDFEGNTTTREGGAIDGGFVDAYDCRFERNSAQSGGAIATGSFAGAGNTYIANTAARGGAMFLDRARRSLVGQPDRPDVFTGNAASQEGGAIFVGGELIELVSVRLERNTAARGGGLYVSEAAGGLRISREGGTGTIIRRNAAAEGEAIYVAAAADTGDILAPCVDWGTIDPAAIGAMIRDGRDDPSLATVRFEPAGPCGCRVDLDGDGALTIFDFLAFQTAFDAGDVATADFDGDGELTIFDFLAFQTEFDAGCG